MIVIDSFFERRGIRKVIFWYAVCLSLILFQTTVMQLGTISSLITLAIFYINFFRVNHSPNYSIAHVSLLFILHAFFITLILCNYNSDIWKFLILSLMFVCSFSINFSDKEYKFVKSAFILSMFIYTILIIYSIQTQPDRLYIHDSIELFGTVFDCNFVGVPIVAASVVALDFIMNEKKYFFLIPFLIFGFCIVLTASRGSLVGFTTANGLFLITYLRHSQIAKFQKILIFLIVLIVIAIALNYYIIPRMEDQVARITNFGEGADNGRFDLWKIGLRVFYDNFLLGGGLFATYDLCGHANHNTYMQVLSGTGLFGSFLFLYIVIYLLKKGYKKDIMLFCLLCGFFIQIAFLDTLTGRFIWPILSLIVMAPYKNKI